MLVHPLIITKYWLAFVVAVFAGQIHASGCELVSGAASDGKSIGVSSTDPVKLTRKFSRHGVAYTEVLSVPYQIKDVEIKSTDDVSIILPTLSQIFCLAQNDSLKVTERISHPDTDEYTLFLWAGNAQVRIPLTINVNSQSLRISRIRGALPVTTTLNFHHQDDRDTALKKVLKFKKNPPMDSQYAQTPFLSLEQSQLKKHGNAIVSKTIIPGRGHSLGVFWSVGLETLNPIKLEDGITTITHEWFLVDPDGKVEEDVIITTSH